MKKEIKLKFKIEKPSDSRKIKWEEPKSRLINCQWEIL